MTPHTSAPGSPSEASELDFMILTFLNGPTDGREGQKIIDLSLGGDTILRDGQVKKITLPSSHTVFSLKRQICAYLVPHTISSHTVALNTMHKIHKHRIHIVAMNSGYEYDTHCSTQYSTGLATQQDWTECRSDIRFSLLEAFLVIKAPLLEY